MATDATFVTNVNLSNNELRNAKAQVLAADPSGVEGKFIYNSTDKQLKFYNGTAWVSGGAAVANLTGQASAFGQSAANGSASTAARSDHYHALPAHDASAHSAIKLSDLAAPAANLAMGGYKLTGLAAGTTNGDSLRYEQVVGVYAPLASPSFTGTVSVPTLAIPSVNTGNPIFMVGTDILNATDVFKLAPSSGNHGGFALNVGLDTSDPMISFTAKDDTNGVIGTIGFTATGGGTITMNKNLAFTTARKITGLAAGTVNGDALRYEQVIGVYAPLNSPTFTGTVTLPSTTSIGTITSTELGYIDGLTSSAQTQLNAKVTGPASATDNRVARFDGTTGKLVQNSPMSVDDAGGVTGVNDMQMTGFLKVGSIYGALGQGATAFYFDGNDWVLPQQSKLGYDFNANSNRITNLADGVAATDAATVGQIQAASQGLSVKQSVRAASAFTGPNPPSGVGAGMSLGITPDNGDRILVKNQSTGSQNGIYIVNTGGAWTRATDFDTTEKIGKNAFVFVEEGTFADTGWVLTNDTPITVGTTTMVWRQFSGAGAFTAGNGLTQSGTTFHVGTAVGGGLIANADDLAIDFYTGWQQTGVTQRVARKVSQVIGGMGPTFTVDHFLGTRDVTVTIRQTAAPYAVVHAGVEITSDTQITVTTAYALNPDELTVVVVG